MSMHVSGANNIKFAKLLRERERARNVINYGHIIGEVSMGDHMGNGVAAQSVVWWREGIVGLGD
jgi:hypothetical protein